MEATPKTVSITADAFCLDEAALRDFIENTPIALHGIGPDGTILWANQAELDLLGYRRDEYVGRNASEFHVGPGSREFLDRLTRGETLNEYPCRIRCRDGSVKDVLINANACLKGSTFVYGRCATLDASGAQQAEDMRSLLAAIVSASDDAIVSKSLDGTIRSWNRGAEQLFGYTAEEAIGQPINLIIPPELQSEELSILEQLRRGQAVDHFETVRVTKAGRRIDVSLTISPVEDHTGRIVGASKVARDISERKRAEQKVRASEERFRAIVESQAEMVCRFRPDGTILFVNGAYARALGTTPEALISDNFWDFIAEDDRSRVRAMLDGLTPEQPEVRIENRFQTVNGERWTLWTNRALAFDSDGRLLEAQSAGIDITGRKRAEQALREREERYELVLAGAEAAIWDWDLAREHVVYSPRWRELRGLSDADVSGTEEEWSKWIHPDDVERVMAALRAHLDGRTPVFAEEYRVWSNDGRWLWILGRGLVSRDAAGRAVRIAGSETDITERKEAESALLDADRRKNEFLATLGHELRNPLAPIRNVLEILKQADRDPQLDRQARDMMVRQLDVIVRLVDDLLDVSRITEGKLQLQKEHVELAAIVQSVVDDSRDLFDEYGQEFRVAVPEERIVVEADPVRLSQVLTNLLSNAGKYTPDGGRIELVVEANASDVRISVRDNGLGIPADKLESIFEMFAQIDHSHERGHKGLGIGLSLVKWLIELHGGWIEAKSEGLGKGSEFNVWLPIAVGDARPHTPTAVPQSVDEAAGCGVLVVDDNADAAHSLATLVEMLGHETRLAFDGLEAVDAAAEFQPQVVLLDIGLPGQSGYEVARQIRGQSWGARIVLVAVTGWGQEEDRRLAIEAGCDYHMTKPLALQSLRNVLATVSAE